MIVVTEGLGVAGRSEHKTEGRRKRGIPHNGKPETEMSGGGGGCSRAREVEGENIPTDSFALAAG